jgi:hypothetical protein
MPLFAIIKTRRENAEPAEIALVRSFILRIECQFCYLHESEEHVIMRSAKMYCVEVGAAGVACVMIDEYAAVPDRAGIDLCS